MSARVCRANRATAKPAKGGAHGQGYRLYCDCGNLAVVRKWGERICARCLALDTGSATRRRYEQ